MEDLSRSESEKDYPFLHGGTLKWPKCYMMPRLVLPYRLFILLYHHDALLLWIAESVIAADVYNPFVSDDSSNQCQIQRATHATLSFSVINIRQLRYNFEFHLTPQLVEPLFPYFCQRDMRCVIDIDRSIQRGIQTSFCRSITNWNYVQGTLLSW